MKGYRIIVGVKKGSGFFELYNGTLKEARARAKVLKEEWRKLAFKRQRLYAVIEEVELQLCKFCDRYCEEQICDRCESIMLDEQIEAKYERERELENE